MARRWLISILAFVATAMVAAGAVPALAAGAGWPDRCVAAIDSNEAIDAILADPRAWTCGADDAAGIDARRIVIRFDHLDREQAPVRRFETRLAGFETMRITAIGTDGSRAWRDLTSDAMTPSTHDWLMSAELPRLSAPVAQVVVDTVNLRNRGAIPKARLVPDVADTDESLQLELLYAAVCGLLAMPLLFNFMFYRVLRERFLFWHAMAVSGMLVYTLLTSGIINRFVALTVDELLLASPLTWGFSIGAAALFAADLVERDKLDERHRRALRLTVPWLLFWSLYYPLAGGPLRASAPVLYYLSFIPILALFGWTIGVAYARGSRAVRFQMMAWLPIAVVGIARIASNLVPALNPAELQLEQNLSVALEVIITSLGVADRFMLIRTERDRARAAARRFETMAEHDPLTGLLNRRTIESRFARLRTAGFSSMAVIDLDAFKAINDRHGHAVGDDVLRATARALSPDDDTLAVRMGGEEFLLLMRGTDTAFRAERRRRAITTRVAAEVPGLDSLVTASMGLVEHSDADAFAGNFLRIYEHCDRLLYEAKFAGRNRTMSAFVRHFDSGANRAKLA